MPNEKILLQWEVAEPQKDPNALIWIILSVLASIAIIVYSFYKQEWLMGAVFIVAIFAITWTLLTKTRPVKIAITPKGISISNTEHEFEKMRGYWFSPRKQTFNFEQKSRLGAIVSFPLGKMSIENIKKNLPEYLVEMKGREEDLFSRISKKLRQ